LKKGSMSSRHQEIPDVSLLARASLRVRVGQRKSLMRWSATAGIVASKLSAAAGTNLYRLRISTLSAFVLVIPLRGTATRDKPLAILLREKIA
jgi:hypothetical protein